MVVRPASLGSPGVSRRARRALRRTRRRAPARRERGGGAGGGGEFRLGERVPEALFLARGPLRLDEEGEPLIEAEGAGRRVLLLRDPGRGDGLEPEGFELLERGFGQHHHLLPRSPGAERIRATYSRAAGARGPDLRTAARAFSSIARLTRRATGPRNSRGPARFRGA